VWRRTLHTSAKNELAQETKPAPDSDTKSDYPSDPGCDHPDDNDETDDCPTGPNCPVCGNGIDDDGGNAGDFVLETRGTVASGTPCDSPLFAAGVLSCASGTTCAGTPATCQ